MDKNTIPSSEGSSEDAMMYQRGLQRQERVRRKRAEAALKAIRDLVGEQAEDEGLWFVPRYVTEHYLQRALRRLHEVIESVT